MTLSLDSRLIPTLITWFNGFVGYREIQKKTQRVKAKLSGIEFASPVLNRRYSFHRTYERMVIRNRLHQKIDTRDLEIHRVLSTIVGLREISKLQTESRQIQLRSRILDALDPDRDIRELEHEVRAFVHYRQAGMEVQLRDGMSNERFDFIVRGARGEFELECKTFSESIGNPISTENSLVFFRAFKTAVKQQPSPPECGILSIKLHAEKAVPEEEIIGCLSDFLLATPRHKEYSRMTISFDRKRHWDEHLRACDYVAVANEIAQQHERLNPHSMVMLSHSNATLLCLSSARRPRPLQAMLDRLKSASQQFTKTRPAMIWAHFLATGERDFLEVVKRARRSGSGPFDVVATRLFRSENRRHVCRLRFSADGESVREIGYPILKLKALSELTISGPAYDLTSSVSNFDPKMTF